MHREDIKGKVNEIIGKSHRLNISIDDVRKFDSSLATFIINSPIEALKVFQEMLNQFINTQLDEQRNGKGNEK